MEGIRYRQPSRDTRGFTLVELMVVIMIIALLAALGYPSYGNFVTKSRRQAARNTIYQIADRQEQFFLDNKTYTTTIIVGGLNMAAVTEGGTYVLSVDAPNVACPMNRCFRVRATPQGTQIGDTCGTMTIDSDRLKTPSGCW